MTATWQLDLRSLLLYSGQSCLRDPPWTVPSIVNLSREVCHHTNSYTGQDRNKFYLVVSGEFCCNIATAQGISLDNLDACNSAAGSSCSALRHGCVSVISSTTTAPPPPTTKMTTTTSATADTVGNEAVTPTPNQTGIATNHNRFHLVDREDDCYDIAVAANITLDDFYALNPYHGKHVCWSTA